MASPSSTGFVSGFADVNGTQLYYELSGSGPCVALLHGFSLDTRLWDAQVEPFAQRFRLLRCDLRGFGRSALPITGESYSHTADLHALLDALEIPNAALVGLSLGGGAALDFALAYPQRARALVLVDAILPGFAWSQETRTTDGAVWAAGRSEGVEAARRLWAQHPLFAPAHRRPAAAAALEAMLAAYSGWHWVNRDPARWQDPAIAAHLGELHLPALVIAGEQDLPDYRRIAGLLAAGIPGAQECIIPAAGHLPNLENPEEFNRVVLEFFTTL